MVNLPDLAIPAVINPEKTRCICLQIPDDETWITNFVNLLSIPSFWFNWQRTGDNTGKQLADVWFDLFVDIDWSVMSCCCDQPPAIFRYNDAGVYQMSTDGGVTWVDAPEYDYRNTSITFPPPAALGITNTKCQAADSAVVILNEDVIQGLDNGSAVQAILEFIAAVLIFYLSAGTLATISIGLFSMAAAIFGYGVAATKAAFTTEVLDQLRCSIYCAMSSDDAMDTTGFANLLSDINSNYSGIIKTSLYSIISAAGAVGITNMLRSNRGSADADCSSCPCSICGDKWFIEGHDDQNGTITSNADGTIHAASAFNTSAGYYTLILTTGSHSSCCTNIGYTQLTGGASNVYHINCGSDDVLDGAGVSACIWHLQVNSAAPFTIELLLTDC